jgi:aminopeptidase YwaD
VKVIILQRRQLPTGQNISVFMNLLSQFLFLVFLFATVGTSAQQKIITEKQFLKAEVDILASRGMCGRGYVNNGREKAAQYLRKRFGDMKLKAINNDGLFGQGFAFPVNTFPSKMELVINGDRLRPGIDFLIDPSSPSYTGGDLSVKKIDFAEVKDLGTLALTVSGLTPDHAYVLEHVTEMCAALELSKDDFILQLPRGCYIIPESRKLTWSVSRSLNPATVFYVKEDALPKKLKKVSVDVYSLFLEHAANDNIIGYVPGLITDTFVAFTAHYDHLGMMGDSTIFPGASDNASGTAMMLSLASYFSAHPQYYSMLFIAFAGEEASLMGSEFFVWHPLVPLSNIKFLTNIDILGDASNGITVVNATEFPREFDLMKSLNDRHQYMPEIRSRGPAANSDHYHFTKAGVHSFFIYSNGGKGHYHDVFDNASQITLNNVGGVAKLLIDFVKELR